MPAVIRTWVRSTIRTVLKVCPRQGHYHQGMSAWMLNPRYLSVLFICSSFSIARPYIHSQTTECHGQDQLRPFETSIRTLWRLYSEILMASRGQQQCEPWSSASQVQTHWRESHKPSKRTGLPIKKELVMLSKAEHDSIITA